MVPLGLCSIVVWCVLYISIWPTNAQLDPCTTNSVLCMCPLMSLCIFWAYTVLASFPQAFPTKRSLCAGGFCACGQLCAWKAWSETSRGVDVWGEWHKNEMPQHSRSPAQACSVHGVSALQSVSGTMNRACFGWGAQALRHFIFVPLPPHVYPT